MSVKPHFLFDFILLICITLLSGCWDHVGIDDRALVIGMGVDYIEGDEPILLTVQVVNFSAFRKGDASSGGTGGAGGESSDESGAPARSAVIVETSTGSSLSAAINNFLKYSSHQVTFSHNRLVILGNELAKKNIDAVFDAMARNDQFRPTAWILVAEKTAHEILRARTDLGILPAVQINDMMINLTKNGSVLPVSRTEFIFQLRSDGKTGLAPLVQVEEKGTNPFSRIKIEKTVVFKNNRLLDNLTAAESQNLIWLVGRQTGASVVFYYQGADGSKKINAKIFDGSTRIIPRITKNEISMDIYCTGRGELLEAEKFTNNIATIKELEQKIEKDLEQKAQETIDKARRIRADFPGFARLIHAKYPKFWHRIEPNWDQELPRIRTKVRFKINLTRFGDTKNPLLEISPLE